MKNMQIFYLNDEDFQKLFYRINNGDMAAREEVIIKSFGMIFFCIKNRFSNVKAENEDLVSLGTIGLIKAVDTYKPDKNIKFLTYATRCIGNEILMYIRKMSHKVEFTKISYDTPIVEDESLTLKEMISGADNTEEDYCDKNELEELRKIVYSLPEKEKFIMFTYFGFDDTPTMNMTQIGQILGYSQSYISRMITRIQHNIKLQLEEKGYTSNTYSRLRK